MDVPSVNERSEQNVTTSDTRVLFFNDRVEWNVLVIALKLPFKSFRLNRDITLKLFHREDTRKIIQKYWPMHECEIDELTTSDQKHRLL